MEYLTTELHGKRFLELLKINSIPNGDRERWALFHIIAGNNELWNLRNKIYDFQERCIEPEILESGICSSSKVLIKLGFNMFNNFKIEESILDILSSLDQENFELAMKAIRIRFNR